MFKYATTFILLLVSFWSGAYAYKHGIHRQIISAIVNEEVGDYKAASEQDQSTENFPLRIAGPSLSNDRIRTEDTSIKYVAISKIKNSIVEPISYEMGNNIHFLGQKNNQLMEEIKKIEKSHFYWAVSGDLNLDGDDDIILFQRNLFEEAKKMTLN